MRILETKWQLTLTRVEDPDLQRNEEEMLESRRKAVADLRIFSKRAARVRAGQLVGFGLIALFLVLFIVLLLFSVFSHGDVAATHDFVAVSVEVLSDITMAGVVVIPGFVAALLTLAIINGGHLGSSFVIKMATWIGVAAVMWAAVGVLSFWLAVWDGRKGPDPSAVYVIVALAVVCVALATAVAEVLPTNAEWRQEQLHVRQTENEKSDADLVALGGSLGLRDEAGKLHLPAHPRMVATVWISIAFVIGFTIGVVTSSGQPQQSAMLTASLIPITAFMIYVGASVGGVPRLAPALAIAMQALALTNTAVVAVVSSKAGQWAAFALTVVWTGALIIGVFPQVVRAAARPLMLVAAGIAQQRRRIEKERDQLQRAVDAADRLPMT